MNSSYVTSQLWMYRQITNLKSQICAVCARDGDIKEIDGIPFINMYSQYSYINRGLMRLGVMKEKSLDERFCWSLEKAIREHQPDALYINFLGMANRLRPVLESFSGKIFIQVHGYDITWDYTSFSTGKTVHKPDYQNFAKSIAEKATFIANSKSSKALLTDIGIDAVDVLVNYFGVPIEPKIDRANRGIVTILYLGRLIDCKGPDLLIEAFNMLCEHGINARLIIAGDGVLMDTCRLKRARSQFSERISLLGKVNADEGARLRKEADIFTAHNCKGPITKQTEAFGVSIIEAMSAGLPVVTGRSGGVVESVIEGKTGFLFEPGDVKQHAELLIRLATSFQLRTKMGNCAREYVKDNFSLDAEKARTLAILNGD